MLTGEYRNVLDGKGRIIFPARLRARFEGSSLVATKSIDRCLWLFTPKEWERVSSRLMEEASPFSEKKRLVLRMFISPAQEVEFDKSGRIPIPQSLREWAGLSHECVLLGLRKYMELWDAAAYDSYLSANDCRIAEAAEEMSSIVF